MFVGEAPGEQEDAQGVPFVGPAGQLFDTMLFASGISRGSIRIANAIRCWPQLIKKANPGPKEIHACSIYLETEIARNQPRVIVAMGNIPCQSLLGRSRISSLRGSAFIYRDEPIFVVPTWHPSYLLRLGHYAPEASDANKEEFKNDLQYAVKLSGLKPPNRPAVDVALREDKALFLLRRVLEQSSTAIDVEGYLETGVVLSVAFSIGGGNSAVAISKDVFTSKVRKLIAKVLADAAIKKIGQNFNDLDRPLLEKEFKCHVKGFEWDTMYASYVQNERRGLHDLDLIAARYLRQGGYDWELSKYLAENNLTMKDLAQVPYEILCKYNGRDAAICHQVRNQQRAKMSTEHYRLSLFYAKVSEPYDRMEEYGIGFDMKYSKRLHKKYEIKISRLEEKIRLEANDPNLNVNAPQQVGAVLFDKLGLHTQISRGLARELNLKTNTGRWSTREEVLVRLSEEVEHPILRMLVRQRDLAKDDGTFIVGYQKRVGPDGRIHVPTILHGTDTGRCAMTLHNVKKKFIIMRSGDRKYILLDQFVAAPGYVLLKGDFSQIEMRVMAEMSGDPEMTGIFERDEDIHHETAVWLFGLKPGEKETEEQRTLCKNVNFGTGYGLDPDGLYEFIKMRTGGGLSRSEVHEFHRTYYGRFRRLREWQLDTIANAHRRGYVEGLFGRTRHLDMSQGKHAANQAINSGVQGSAHDLLLLAILQLWKVPGRQFRILMDQHDAALIEVPQVLFASDLAVIKKCFVELNTYKWFQRRLRVPLKAEFKSGPAWGSLKTV